MGTIEGSESPELVAYLQSQRTMSPEEVDATGKDHPALIRYTLHTCPSANAASAH